MNEKYELARDETEEPNCFGLKDVIETFDYIEKRLELLETRFRVIETMHLEVNVALPGKIKLLEFELDRLVKETETVQRVSMLLGLIGFFLVVVALIGIFK